ncbi:MAG: thioesterase family protein [Actinomycetota bacterium]|nr:thioesterase family protein [Actinomycetota bacterium]
MEDAFYVAEGDRYIPTAWTRGPWDPGSQHAGPPAALLARSIESIGTKGMRVARFTIEILRAIPIKPLRIAAKIDRPGRRVEFVTASMTDEGSEVARASAWRIRAVPGSAPEVTAGPTSLPGPNESETAPVPDPAETSYFRAMEWRFARGVFFDPGPAAVWMRMRKPLVAGEEPSPLTRVLVAADSGNGISSVLDFRTHLFINVELTAHFTRMPEGEWVCLDAHSLIDPDGVGVAQSTLWDVRGRFGGATQSLVVGPR